MLNEPASTRSDHANVRVAQAPLSREEMLRNEIRQMVASVLSIESESFLESETMVADPSGLTGVGTHLVATFEGKLTLESEVAYEKLDLLLAPTRHLALFREAKGEPSQIDKLTASIRQMIGLGNQAEPGKPLNPDAPHVIHVITGRVNPAPPRPWWPNLLLFIATLLSVLYVGATLAISEIGETDLALAQQLADRIFLEMWRGFPYAFSILLILGAHELGHYFAARHHKLGVTLPYFIPVPIISLFGTMGAFIQLRQPMKNRKMLLDVGAAGPLTGLIFAVPILLIGLSQTRLIPPSGGGFYEGDSLLYAGAKILTFGHFVPDGNVDVCINCSQLAWAGWTGLLVTALNLIPIGQLDGGHVLYSLIGEKARKLYFPLLAIMIALVFVTDVWLIWVLLLLLFGRVYATPLDMITPLDQRRRWIAILALVVFVLIFVPAPLQQQAIDPNSVPVLPPRGTVSILPMVAPAVVLLGLRLRR